MPDFLSTHLGSTSIGLGEITVRLLVATALTMVIGLEREVRSKPAGLRTHMLVGLGAAAFYIVGYEVFMGDLTHASQARVDLTRIMEGLIGGIGFLGAGAIIQGRGNVEGLTTAAGMWVSGAIGLICGAGLYGIAVVVSLLTFFVILVLGFLERRFLERISSRSRKRDTVPPPDA